MLKNYFRIAWRNLLKNRTSSFINIGGLSVGMAVAMLIGLWIYDELNFNKSFSNYGRIGQVWQFVKFTDEKSAYPDMPIPMAEELRGKYPEFRAVSLVSQNLSLILSSRDKKFIRTGNYVEPDFSEMMSIKMIAGPLNGLKEVNSIMLSESLAKDLFGAEQPINKIIEIDNKLSVKVTGVYEDFRDNTVFRNVLFLLPWEMYEANESWVKNSKNDWDNNSFQIYVQLKDGADFNKVSTKIKDIRMKRGNPPAYKPEFFLFPMSRWHLFSDFKNGVNVGGQIAFVWLFGIIGIFVLLLACINFMNLSTARSEKRSKEVGIRKAIGSDRRQLILQFLSESFLVAVLAFVLSLLLVQLFIPFFNDVSDKKMSILWPNPLFWVLGLGFSLLTSLIAGSYPALYLSSFQPVKALKGTFKVGRFAAVPRKILVVLQFTVSVTLIIGTIFVLRQVQFAKDRPVGYERNGLIEIKKNTPELYRHYDALRNELLNTGAVFEVSESSGFVTTQYGGITNISWNGKDPDFHPLLMSNSVTLEYGKTVGWKIMRGRDFSKDFSMDSLSMILNEAAVKIMGFKNPIGEIVKMGAKTYKVIGIITDMVKESPFEPVKPSFFILNYDEANVINIKLGPTFRTSEALGKIKDLFLKYDPASPFTYTFVDEQYAKKFGDEERIGKLAGFFSVLAILISCLGLFGLTSFVAEQRTKEVGIRKVLGASIFSLWRLLSIEFVGLVLISLLIAIPTAYHFMHNWLQNYVYRTEMSWWIFAASGFGALLIALITVSFQAIKAAVANPIWSLKTE